MELAIPEKTQRLRFSCGKCSSRWGGQKTCHCSVCHHTFSGIGTFTKHRQHNGQACILGHLTATIDAMGRIGLVLSERAGYNVWAFHDVDSRWERDEEGEEDDSESVEVAHTS